MCELNETTCSWAICTSFAMVFHAVSPVLVKPRETPLQRTRWNRVKHHCKGQQYGIRSLHHERQNDRSSGSNQSMINPPLEKREMPQQQSRPACDISCSSRRFAEERYPGPVPSWHVHLLKLWQYLALWQCRLRKRTTGACGSQHSRSQSKSFRCLSACAVMPRRMAMFEYLPACFQCPGFAGWKGNKCRLLNGSQCHGDSMPAPTTGGTTIYLQPKHARQSVRPKCLAKTLSEPNLRLAI